MRLSRLLLRSAFWLLVSMVVCMGPVFAAEEEEEEEEAPIDRPVLRATILPREARGALTIDGILSEAEWAAADSVSDLITVEPEEGAEPNERTVFRVLATPDEVVIGVRCYEDPAGIVTYSKARDSELDDEDHILLVLDTFGDQRSGYVFAVNPSGARFDGLVGSEGDEANSNWDAVWQAAAARDDAGWSAEILIPIKSLSFAKGLHEWGFNLQRRVQRLQETSRWSGASQDYEIFQTSRAGVLAGLPDFDLGLGLTVRPSFVLDANRPMPGTVRKFLGEMSLDGSQRLGPNLLATVTVNTDFGETDVDVRQTNLGRFDLLFPEKRSFFLEGADIFEFGTGLDVEDANVLPLFTRRIGLFFPEEGGDEDGLTIPIRVGGKLQGRVGETNLGALVVATDKVDEFDVPEATMGAIRVRQNVLSESSLGMIATFGDPLDRERSWLAGADFTYRTSEFRGDKNLIAGVWALTTNRDELTGDKHAFGAKIGYPNDLVDASLTYLRIGDEFDPSLGFVQRTGNVLRFTSEYNPRPEWPLVRQQFYEVSAFVGAGIDGEWESYAATIKPLDWQFESGDRFDATVDFVGERPDEPFAVFESAVETVEIPDGEYSWNRFGIGAELAQKRKISGNVNWSFGDFYDGSLHSIEGSVVIKPMPVLTLEGSGERNIADLPQGDFTQYLYGARAELKVSPDFQVSNLIQYDNESRNFGSATRLRWTFHPLGDLFLSYNHNLVRSVVEGAAEEEALRPTLGTSANGRARTGAFANGAARSERWDFLADRIVIKIQYAWRL